MAADPTSAPCPRGLELRIAARGSAAVLILHNCGSHPLTVLSHVDAGERHYDWFTIELADGAGTRVLRLYDDRNESGRVTAVLAPGENLEHAIDVAAWARRKVNGALPLGPGRYRMRSTYEVSEPGTHWMGTVTSPATDVTIPKARLRARLGTLLRARGGSTDD